MENMNPFDIIVLAILVLSAFWGGLRGVVAQIATIASWFLSLFITARFYPAVEMFFANNKSKTLIAVAITFATSVVILTFIFHVFKKMVRLVGLGEFDRQMGALLGVVKGGGLCVLIAFFAVVANEKSRAIVNNSKTGPVVIMLIDRLGEALPDTELKEKFHELVRSNELKETRENSVKGNVDDLKTYLVKSVLNSSAAAVVEEADAVEKAREEAAQEGKKSRKTPSDFFQAFMDNVKEVSNNLKDSAVEALTKTSSVEEYTTDTDLSAFRRGAADGSPASEYSRVTNTIPMPDKENSLYQDYQYRNNAASYSSSEQELPTNTASHGEETIYAEATRYQDDRYQNDDNPSYDADEQALQSYNSSNLYDWNDSWSSVLNVLGSLTTSSADPSYESSEYSQERNYSSKRSSAGYDSGVYSFDINGRDYKNSYVDLGTNYQSGYSNDDTQERSFSNSRDLASHGSEFGFGSFSDDRPTTSRRRSSERTASSARLGTYSYSNSY